ncbi:MAG: hypothetical protein J2P43_05710 [Candidatus Dormibacteraeota bacterium]|nr:hypothetical protein [Candidatus Dormibacteraeota bacterium]
MQFDAAAAEAVLTSLKSAIATLRTKTEIDLKNAAKARDGWKGAWADQFATEELPWIGGEATRLLSGMLLLQSQIGHAIEAARQLQTQHDLANQRWERSQRPQPVR